MFRSPHELEAHARYHIDRLVSERQRCALGDRVAADSSSLVTRLRRRLGIALIRVGTAIAGIDGLRGVATRSAWPELANR